MTHMEFVDGLGVAPEFFDVPLYEFEPECEDTDTAVDSGELGQPEPDFVPVDGLDLTVGQGGGPASTNRRFARTRKYLFDRCTKVTHPLDMLLREGEGEGEGEGEFGFEFDTDWDDDAVDACSDTDVPCADLDEPEFPCGDQPCFVVQAEPATSTKCLPAESVAVLYFGRMADRPIGSEAALGAAVDYTSPPGANGPADWGAWFREGGLYALSVQPAAETTAPRVELRFQLDAPMLLSKSGGNDPEKAGLRGAVAQDCIGTAGSCTFRDPWTTFVFRLPPSCMDGACGSLDYHSYNGGFRRPLSLKIYNDSQGEVCFDRVSLIELDGLLADTRVTGIPVASGDTDESPRYAAQSSACSHLELFEVTDDVPCPPGAPASCLPYAPVHSEFGWSEVLGSTGGDQPAVLARSLGVLVNDYETIGCESFEDVGTWAARITTAPFGLVELAEEVWSSTAVTRQCPSTLEASRTDYAGCPASAEDTGSDTDPVVINYDNQGIALQWADMSGEAYWTGTPDGLVPGSFPELLAYLDDPGVLDGIADSDERSIERLLYGKRHDDVAFVATAQPSENPSLTRSYAMVPDDVEFLEDTGIGPDIGPAEKPWHFANSSPGRFLKQLIDRVAVNVSHAGWGSGDTDGPYVPTSARHVGGLAESEHRTIVNSDMLLPNWNVTDQRRRNGSPLTFAASRRVAADATSPRVPARRPPA